jgi:hypothetical protein
MSNHCYNTSAGLSGQEKTWELLLTAKIAAAIMNHNCKVAQITDWQLKAEG